MTSHPVPAVLLAGFLAACSTTIVTQGEGTGGTSTNPTTSSSGSTTSSSGSGSGSTTSSSGSGSGSTTSSSGSGSGSTTSSSGSGSSSSSGTSINPGTVSSQHGSCNVIGAPNSIATTTLYNGSLNYVSLANVINFSSDQVWSEVITDQATYQPFQDYGLPAVDFTANAVMVTAAVNDCGGNAAPSNMWTGNIDGIVHLQVVYSLLAPPPASGSGPCTCEPLSYYTLYAVQVPNLMGPINICVLEDTGC